MSGILYLVPTPIGNLSDLSDRCRQTLEQVDFIAAEDTRVTRRLLSHLNLHKPLVSYHEHNKTAAGPAIIERIAQGQTCALVTDAGCPAISDPGEDLVVLAAQSQIPVCAIPGPCAAITALSVSALPSGRFAFEGFLPAVKKARAARLEELSAEQRTMIFYEAPHRLRQTLTELAAAFGPQRQISLCRELTKLHEQILRMTLGEAAEYYAAQEPRGEYVLVVAGGRAAPPQRLPLTEAAAMVRAQIQNGAGRRQAVKEVSAQTGWSKNELYEASVKE